MHYVSDRNTYVRVNRHLKAHCLGTKLRKARRRSTNSASSYFLENPDGSISENVNLEQLAHRLGCLNKYEKIGVPPTRTRAEAKVLIDELAKDLAAGKAAKKAIAWDVRQFSKFISRPAK